MRPPPPQTTDLWTAHGKSTELTRRRRCFASSTGVSEGGLEPPPRGLAPQAKRVALADILKGSAAVLGTLADRKASPGHGSNLRCQKYGRAGGGVPETGPVHGHLPPHGRSRWYPQQSPCDVCVLQEPAGGVDDAVPRFGPNQKSPTTTGRDLDNGTVSAVIRSRDGDPAPGQRL